MSFSWTPITSGVTKTLPDHLNELRANTNILASKLNIPNYSWSKLPVSSNQIIEYDAMIEIRNALDYIDNNNVCTTHNSTQNSTHNSSLCTTHNNNVETGNNSTDYSSYNSNVETGNNARNHSSYNYNVETVRNSTDYSSYRNDHDATVRTAHDVSYCSSRKTSDHSDSPGHGVDY